jgi:hypothetical protein
MASHGQAREDTMAALRGRKAFRRSGFAMSAIEGAAYSAGRMPEEYANEYMTAANAGRITYTVMSYATPIAWILDDGTKVQPPVKYSPTTSQHQGMLYAL